MRFLQAKKRFRRCPARTSRCYRPEVEGLETRLAPALILGLTTANRLISFDSANPSVLLSDVAITGLPGTQTLAGIDMSPYDGKLYALGRNTSGNGSNVYTLNAQTGALTDIRVFAAAENGTNFGMDFDPVSGNLRVVNDVEGNRIGPATVTGTTVAETSLAYAAGDSQAGTNPLIAGLAYTSNFAGASNTSAFAIDAGSDTLVRLGSPSGSPDAPSTGKLFTLASLGLNTNANVGLDLADGGSSTLFASLTPVVSGVTQPSRFYSINQGVFGLNDEGQIGGLAAGVFVKDIAIALVGALHFDADTVQVNEAAGSIDITITRTLPSLAAASMTVGVASGNATTDVDFSLPAATVSFAAGETSKTFTVDIVNDDKVEVNETVLLFLTNPTNNVGVTNPATTTLTIIDDEPPPIVTSKLSGGLLTITADNFHSDVTITEQAVTVTDLGAGKTDGIFLSEAFFGNKVTLKLGSGNDFVILADVSVVGAFQLSAGDGNDTFNVEHDAFNSNASTFLLAAVKYTGEGGNDTVNLGLDADDLASFLASASLDGGAGSDTLDRVFAQFLGGNPRIQGF